MHPQEGILLTLWKLPMDTGDIVPGIWRKFAVHKESALQPIFTLLVKVKCSVWLSWLLCVAMVTGGCYQVGRWILGSLPHCSTIAGLGNRDDQHSHRNPNMNNKVNLVGQLTTKQVPQSPTHIWYLCKVFSPIPALLPSAREFIANLHLCVAFKRQVNCLTIKRQFTSSHY